MGPSGDERDVEGMLPVTVCKLTQLTLLLSLQTFDGFLQTCVDAGPDRCALATPNSTLPSLLRRITNLREHLHENPLPVALPAGAGATVLTTSAIQHAIFRGLYAPVFWPQLAESLAAAELGDGSKIMQRLGDWDLAEKDPTDNVFQRSMDHLGSGLTCHVNCRA